MLIRVNNKTKYHVCMHVLACHVCVCYVMHVDVGFQCVLVALENRTYTAFLPPTDFFLLIQTVLLHVCKVSIIVSVALQKQAPSEPFQLEQCTVCWSSRYVQC